MSSIDQLCPNCGLCCDSTLFADVELRAGDDAKRLQKLGLTLAKKGRGSLCGSLFTADDAVARRVMLGTAAYHGR